MSPARFAWLFSGLLACASVTPLAAQSVRGRVIDAATSQSIAGVQLELVASNGRTLSTTTTNEQGRFALAAEAGRYQLRSSFIGYSDAVMDVVLENRVELVVDVRMAVGAIAVEPLLVTARRHDPRHDATFEGMLARYELAKPVGSERVVKFDDVEMRHASKITDVLQWMRAQPISVQGRPQSGERTDTALGEITTNRGCAILFFNGTLVNSEPLAEQYMQEALVPHLEAVEYYRYWGEAPMEFRQVPAFMFIDNVYNCSVVAMWGRRTPGERYLGPVQPFRGRLGIAAAWQQASGRHAPDAAPGMQAELMWYIMDRVAIGFHGRRSVAPIAVADLAVLAAEDPAAMDDRSYKVEVVGFEVRYDLPRLSVLQPFASGRALLGSRSYNPFRAEDGARYDSRGVGGGASIGIEHHLMRRLSLYAAVDHERMSYKPFYGLRLPPEATKASWSTTALRAGAAFGLMK